MPATGRVDPTFWQGRTVLATGHTGFEGAWLTLWLQAMGARVVGMARSVPSSPSLYELARVGEGVVEQRPDIRDAEAVREAFARHEPEIVIHRLIPDIMRGALAGDPVPVRSPEAVRPWQHVLNPLSGYLCLAQALHASPEHQGGWNFGPAHDDARSVRWIADHVSALWPGEIHWEIEEGPTRTRRTFCRWTRRRHGASWAGRRRGRWTRCWPGSWPGTSRCATARTCAR